MSVRGSNVARFRRRSLLVLAALALAPFSAYAQSFHPLGFLSGNTEAGDQPKISADGTIIVGNNTASGRPTAFRATYNRTTNTVGAPVAIAHSPLADTSGHPVWSSAAGVSDPTTGALVIAGRASVHQGPLFAGSQTNEAFRWAQAGGMAGIGFLPGPGINGAGSSATAVNAGIKGSVAGGSIIVGSSDTNTPTAFRWSGGKMTKLGFLPGDVASTAYAVSANGAVVTGGSCNGTSPTATCHPFRWTQATGLVNLGFLPGAFIAAGYGVSADGSVVVGPACNITNTFVTCKAFRWTAATKMTALGAGIAYDVSAKGDVVVGSITNNLGDEVDAFVWTVTGQQSLTKILTSHGVNLSGWKLTGATGVSADGAIIVGRGVHNGVVQNWVVNLPAPGTYYEIKLSGSPAAGGTESGAGMFPKNTTRTVTATPKPGFTFVDWQEGGVNLRKPASYQFALTANRTLVALFKAGRFTISVSGTPATGGTVSGAGTFDGGTQRSVKATPASGYVFDNWTEGGVVVSTAATYTFTVTKNRALVAHFRKPTFTIAVSASPAAGGTVSGGGTFGETQRTVTATDKPGYIFSKWFDSDTNAVVSTSSSYTFTLTKNRNLIAIFVAAVTFTTAADPPEGGSVAGAGKFPAGQCKTFTATPNSNYVFTNWTGSGGPAFNSTSNPVCMSATSDTVMTAHFAPAFVTLTLGFMEGNGGTLSGAGTYAYGQNVTIIATPNGDQRFCGWYGYNGDQLHNDPNHIIALTADTTILAVFRSTREDCYWHLGQTPVILTLGFWESNDGVLEGAGTYLDGERVVIHAIPNAGQKFCGWYGDDDQALDPNPFHQVYLPFDKTLYAVIRPDAQSCIWP